MYMDSRLIDRKVSTVGAWTIGLQTGRWVGEWTMWVYRQEGEKVHGQYRLTDRQVMMCMNSMFLVIRWWGAWTKDCFVFSFWQLRTSPNRIRSSFWYQPIGGPGLPDDFLQLFWAQDHLACQDGLGLTKTNKRSYLFEHKRTSHQTGMTLTEVQLDS